MITDFPLFNASLNGLAAILIVLGWITVKNRQILAHKALMLAAMTVSAVFLASYLYYHIVIKQGVSTSFKTQWPDAPDMVRYLYYAILLSHTILAVVVAPMAIFATWQGIRDNIAKHKSIAKITMPLWLYVSVTGVVVYWMLYRLYR